MIDPDDPRYLVSIKAAERAVSEWIAKAHDRYEPDIMAALIAGGLRALERYAAKEFGHREAYALLQQAADEAAAPCLTKGRA